MNFNRFHQELHRWYASEGRRGLPWRNTSDPYAVYVSEIMLQQTQVATVLERFYFPFLERFPNLRALSNATREEVLKAWEGLGYYRRAGHLHEAAKQCAGKLPRTVEGLMQLPGIGRNTAHAVAAFAHHAPLAVMEANVKRVLSRIFAMKSPGEKELWEKAEALLDKAQPFDYNQAMMDLGALVCRPTSPRCGECPASIICKGKAAPESYPVPKVKKKTPVRHKHIVAFRNRRGEYYARPREGRLLGGLYQFVEMDAGATHATLAGKKFPLKRGARLGNIRQQYSHFTLEAEVSLIAAGDARGPHWHAPQQLYRLPFSKAEQKILALLAGSKAATG
jgi:A/G-specific adenine glycosylase